jgi:casein kinase II subunit alpha
MPNRSSTSQGVTVKTAPDWPLKNERHVLEAVRDSPYIRPIIDTIDDPPSVILKHMDDNLLVAPNATKLERADIKFVARNVLQALEALHSCGYVHTGTVQAVQTTRHIVSN